MTDLTTRTHPTFDVSDFTIVENTKTTEIGSSMNSIPQIWSYEGIEFRVGRPELVGTSSLIATRGCSAANLIGFTIRVQTAAKKIKSSQVFLITTDKLVTKWV
ncbi:MAG: hypothetical protein IZT55_06335 [Anaerolineae bacterium]|nr:hypothetical protein [Anaerolineae bacterium]